MVETTKKSSNRALLLLVGALLVLTMCSGGSAAGAEKTPHWKTVAGWEISVDRGMAYGCFMAKGYGRSGAALRVGYNRKRGRAYLMILNLYWKTIEVGKDYALSVQFDARPAWSGAARGEIFASGNSYLYLQFAESDFLLDLMRSHILVVRFKNTEIARLSLRGSYAAGLELVTCQENMNAVKKAKKKPKADLFDDIPKADPFAQGVTKRRNRDPFAE